MLTITCGCNVFVRFQDHNFELRSQEENALDRTEYAENENIQQDHRNFGWLVRAFDAAFVYAVPWKPAESGRSAFPFDDRDIS